MSLHGQSRSCFELLKKKLDDLSALFAILAGGAARQKMQAKNFDELTKALANSTSRRHALRVIVTASLGGLFGLVGIRSVFGSNRNCAQWCAQVFGPNTSAAGRCTRDAAHGGGICVTCGNVAPSSICCVRNTSGYCQS